jgi:hypothetical protein
LLRQVFLCVDIDLDGERMLPQPIDDVRVHPGRAIHRLAWRAPRRRGVDHEQSLIPFGRGACIS